MLFAFPTQWWGNYSKSLFNSRDIVSVETVLTFYPQQQQVIVKLAHKTNFRPQNNEEHLYYIAIDEADLLHNIHKNPFDPNKPH